MEKENEIPASIKDELGLETGIAIDKFHAWADRKNDCINITGRMSCPIRPYTDEMFEPEVLVDLMDSEDHIRIISTSCHKGYLSKSHDVSFSIHLQHISRYVSWDEIKEFYVRIIYVRQKSAET